MKVKIVNDNVDHPKHYTSHPSGIECIDIVLHLPFGLGCVIKYLWRAGLKNSRVEDLQKAMWYMKKTPLVNVHSHDINQRLIEKVLQHENHPILQSILQTLTKVPYDYYVKVCFNEDMIEILQRQINDLQIEEDE